MPALTFDDLIDGIPSWLDQALEMQESGGNPNAVSPKGAFGRRQIMPATAADPGFGIKPFDFNAPDQDAENVRLGRDYLSTMLNRYGGDQEAALVAYNWGPGNADKWVKGGKDFNRLPRETQGYVRNIMASRPQEETRSSGVLTFDDLLEDQPQMQQAGISEQEANNTLTTEEQASVVSDRTLGGFLQNAGRNAADIGSGLAAGAAHVWNDPQGSIDSLLNTSADDAEKFVKDMVRATGRDLGFHFNPDRSLGWSKEQLADNLYERPIDVGLSASMFTPAAVNPLRLATKGAAKAGSVPAKAVKYAVGETSGLGPKAIEEAYRSGRVGGREGEAFRMGMRGDLDPDAPVDLARGAVDDLKADRSAEYVAGKEKWAASPAPLNFEPIEQAYENVMGIKRFRGKDLKPSVAKARDQVRAAMDEWRADPGAWTAEGFDALKQKIQDIGHGLDPLKEGAARSVVGAVAASIKKEISKQAPDYAKSMKAYERASQALDEVQRTLSLGKKSSYDTALRKLQSVLRNNAFTNWSARAKLAELISQKAPELMPMLSGMAASAKTPRGLPGKLLGSGGVGLAGYGAMSLEPMSLLTLLGAGAAASPRIVGEIAHGAGRIRGGFDKAAPYSPMAAALLSLGQQ